MRAVLVLALCSCTTAAPQLPRQTTAPTAQPATVRASLAADGEHACAIQASRRVTCWGRTSVTPSEVPGVVDAVGIAAGPKATCAWTGSGRVVCWDDARTRSAPAVDEVVQVTVGDSSACALRTNGRVACWTLGRSEVREVTAIVDVVEIAGVPGSGPEDLCARTKSGAVACGNGKFEDVPELAGATSISAAGARYAALLPGKRLARWVGFTGRPMPELIEDVDGDRVVVGGHVNGQSEICVLGARARCWVWTREPMKLVEEPSLPVGVRDLAIDTEVTCARVGERVTCWGRAGRRGDGETEYPRDFVPVPGITDVRQLEAAGRTICALRATGRVACWGERLRGEDDTSSRAHTIDREPMELPGVTDAVEIAMETGGSSDGDVDLAVAVCARRKRGATCWTSQNGQLVTYDAPELASSTKLVSGPTTCGVSSGAVRCVALRMTNGRIPSFSEADYHKFIYQGGPDTANVRVARELARRLQGALAANRSLEGFHASGASDPIGPIDRTFQPPVQTVTDAVELRRIAWSLDWDNERKRGAVCLRRRDGTVACWGERDYLGAGLHSATTAPTH